MRWKKCQSASPVTLFTLPYRAIGLNITQNVTVTNACSPLSDVWDRWSIVLNCSQVRIATKRPICNQQPFLMKFSKFTRLGLDWWNRSAKGFSINFSCFVYKVLIYKIALNFPSTSLSSTTSRYEGHFVTGQSVCDILFLICTQVSTSWN